MNGKKWNLHALLVEMENGVATSKNSVAASQKVKQSYHMIQQFHFKVYTKEERKQVHTKTCTQMLLTALVVIAQNGNNSNVHQQMNG